MANDERQWPIERLLAAIDELGPVLGEASAPALDRVRASLRAALADRERGAREDAIMNIARAMAEVATLGDSLAGDEPALGGMMRAVTGELIKGFAADDRDAIERNMKVVESQAGTPKKPDGAF